MAPSLEQKIQHFYDTSSGVWEKIWGEHMHHGYYGALGLERKDRRQAQIDLIAALLAWVGLSRSNRTLAPQQILDVGCGIGGSALYLAEQFSATVTGVTLSPVQAARATERAETAGLAAQTQFQVANALALSFAEATFDLVWSLESGEHLPDKRQFLQECYRVLRPGGLLICATWCHRSTEIAPLNPVEQQHLQAIYRVYCLPYVISLSEYGAIAREIGYQDVRTVDWSRAVAPFWDAVIRSAFEPGAVLGLLQSGWSTIQGAFALRLMSQGYERGLIRYGVLCGRK